MKKIILAGALALGLVGNQAIASENPECRDDGEMYPVAFVIDREDGSKDVCICLWDPGSPGKGEWGCEWKLYSKAGG